MTFCGKCGTKMQDGEQFCPSCGNKKEAEVARDYTGRDKPMSVLAYILFFIPMLTGDYKKSPFVKFHTNQGLILFILYMIVSFIALLLPLNWFYIITLPVAILQIICIVNAVKGKSKPMPIIGGIKIIK